MGYYINPTDKTKEEFLAEHGRRLTNHDLDSFDWTKDELPVCLVVNHGGLFTAAGIAYCPQEMALFLTPDHRPKSWYAVKKEHLAPYLDEDS